MDPKDKNNARYTSLTSTPQRISLLSKTSEKILGSIPGNLTPYPIGRTPIRTTSEILQDQTKEDLYIPYGGNTGKGLSNSRILNK